MSDFYTPEEAMELQNHFRKSDPMINEQLTEAMRREVGDRIIELGQLLTVTSLNRELGRISFQ